MLSNPWDLFGQAERKISTAFDEAVHHFYMNEFDETLQLLDQVENSICEQEKFAEQCIYSKIIRANISRNRREFEKAGSIIRQGLKAAQDRLSKSHPLTVHAHAELAYLEADQSSYKTAKEWADAGVQIVNNFGLTGKPRARAYLVLGFVEGGLGNYSEAITHYQEGFKAIEKLERTIEIKKMLTQAHNNIGVAFRRLGNIEKAMSHYQTTLALVRETFGSNHLEMGYAYNSIGTVYYLNGDFGTAADYFQRSADIFRLNLGENSSPYAAALNNTATAYYDMNDFKNAAEILEKAQRIKENTLGRDHPDTAVGYTNLARIYEQNGDYDAALNNHKLSISVRKNLRGADHPSLVAPYLAFGDFYIKTKEYKLAREQFVEAERIIKFRLGNNHPDMWAANNRIAKTYQEEKNYEKAISYYQQALYLMTNGMPVTKESYNFNAISHPYQFMVPISSIGEVSLEKYEQSGEISALRDAYYFLMWSAGIIEELQTGYQSEASKLNLIDQNYSIYTSSIKTCNYLYQETAEEKWLDEIFRLSEMSRSRIALELLQELQARDFAGVPGEIINEERAINTNITDYYQKLHAEQEKGFEADQNVIAAYRDSLFNSRQNLTELTEDLEQNYPDYYMLKYDQSFADREAVAGLLKEDETLVNYVVSEEQVYALILDRENISFHDLGAPDSLAVRIKSLREAVSSDNPEEYSKIAHNLYKKLLKPLMSVIKTSSLVIVPDQILFYLPFEMLLTEESRGSGYYNMPYMIREHRISYVSSATVLQMLAEREVSNPRNLFAAAPFHEVAIRTSDQAGSSRHIAGLSPLPLTRFETRRIAEIFEENRSFLNFFSPEKMDILAGREATKSAIENTALDDYGYLHFATHAFVNEENPALSGIAFWGGENDDGIIYVNDIYNMNFNADLVTLGACETGLGTVYKGEGMIGFTRAFMYAGVSNLLVSMWRVSDQPTARLMIDFYKFVKQGYSYAESLQRAKMELINQPEFAAPRNWAAFVLQGR